MLIVSLLFLPWYSLTHTSTRGPSSPSSTWICGDERLQLHRLRDLPDPALAAADRGALAPLILAWIIVRGHKLSWAPGEMTMVVGFTPMVLIGYNGIIDKPGTGDTEIGISLDYGYWLALAGIDRDRGHGLPPLAGRPEAGTQGPRHRLIR